MIMNTTNGVSGSYYETAERFYSIHCSYLPAMAGWFAFSALLTTYNKKVFGAGDLAFPCPLAITTVHFAVQWLFSLGISSIWPEFFGGTGVLQMNWAAFLSTSIPCGFITACDVGLSNLALVRITITFYTMIKASSPIFVVLSAFVFGIERITPGLILVVMIISAGEFLTVVGEQHGGGNSFDTVGMVLCVGASVSSGLRWTLVQLKIQKLDPPLKTAIATMRVLSPSMFIFMLLASLLIEKPWIDLNPANGSQYFATVDDGMKTGALALVGAIFAVCMILCELYLIMKSNAIVLMIGGVLKEIFTISIGVTKFKDKLNIINIAGFVVVFLGVILYKVIFHMKKLEEADVLTGDDKENLTANSSYRQVFDESLHNAEMTDMMSESPTGEDGPPVRAFEHKHSIMMQNGYHRTNIHDTGIDEMADLSLGPHVAYGEEHLDIEGENSQAMADKLRNIT